MKSLKEQILLLVDLQKIDLKIYSKLGKKKYSLRANLQTKNKRFCAKSYGWKIADAAHQLIEKLEKRIIKFKEKVKDKEIGKPKAYSERLV